MTTAFRYSHISVFLVMFLIGCSGSGHISDPLSPSPVLTDTNLQSATDGNQHSLWSYGLVAVDASGPGQPEAEFIPIRQVAAHFNIINWLETGPCTDCLQITGIEHSGTGTLLVDVELTHPFDNPNFTGFDVRGIVMFVGNHNFPVSDVTVSDRTLGNGELVNADGYTRLYNPEFVGHGIEGYLPGKLSTLQYPNADVNGYKRHISDDLSNTRNAFYAGDSITVTYEIDMPDSQFIFGYAVDACWGVPFYPTVTNPMTDFGPDANCYEAWQLSVSVEPVGDGFTDCGGSAIFTLDIYDWQGLDYKYNPYFECPELFDGFQYIEWDSDHDGFTRYREEFENTQLPPPGEYLCLVSKKPKENTPDDKFWLDMTAYQLISLECVEYTDQPPVAVADVSTHNGYIDFPIEFDASGSYDGDCDGSEITNWEWDWDSDGVYDETGVSAVHSWDADGNYNVQLRVTDDEDNTAILDEPIPIIIDGPVPFDPVDITNNEINLPITDIAVDGGYAFLINRMGNFQVYDLTDPEYPDYLTEIDLGKNLRSITLHDGYAYVVNSSVGIQVVDIDPPESANHVKTIETPPGAADIAIDGDYAYVAVSNNSDSGGLYVIDINPLETAEVVSNAALDEDLEYVVVDGIFAYVATSDSYQPFDIYGRLYFVDIEDPLSPVLMSYSYNTHEPRGMVYDEGYIYLLEYTLVYDFDGWFPSCHFSVLDATTPGGILEEYGYSTGWIPEDLCKLGDYFYVIGEEGKFRTYDVSDPSGVSIVNTIDIPFRPVAIDAADGYAYYLSPDGLGVVDIDPPGSEHQVNTLPTCAGATDVAISGDYACVLTSFSNSIKIVDMTDPGMPFIANTVQVDSRPDEIKAYDGFAYVLDSGLSIIDIDPPETASVAATYPVAGNDIAISGSYAYLAGQNFTVLDINPPDDPELVYTVPLENSGVCIGVNTNSVCIVTWNDYMYLIDITDPSSPVLQDSEFIFYSGNPSIVVDNSYAYLLKSGGLKIFSITQPDGIQEIILLPIASSTAGLAKSGDYIFTTRTDSNSTGYFEIIDVAVVDDAFIISSTELPETFGDLDVLNNIACVASGNSGLRIVELW